MADRPTQTPRFFTVNDRPVKLVPMADGGLDVQVLDLHTGAFVRDMNYLTQVLVPGKDVDELSPAEFDGAVARIRRERGLPAGERVPARGAAAPGTAPAAPPSLHRDGDGVLEDEVAWARARRSVRDAGRAEGTSLPGGKPSAAPTREADRIDAPALAPPGADLVSLFRRILAHPDDDAVRLAYADTLERDPSSGASPEDRAARAELIRVQVELRRELLAHGRSARWSQLFRREQVLLDKHADGWGSFLADLGKHPRFRRGFVDQLTLDAELFLRRADDLFARAPVRHLDLKGVQPVAARLFASPHLARLRSLGLRETGLGDDEARLLAASPHLGDLRWLDLSYNRIGADGLEALAASRALPHLRLLLFNDNLAPDPVPRAAGVDWDGSVQDVETPSLAAELQQRHGKRSWLDPAGPATRSPIPDRDEL